MSMKVITSDSGLKLREYVKDFFIENPNIYDGNFIVFPEYSLDAREQGLWYSKNSQIYELVITLSPYIISDTPKEDLIIISPEKNYSSFYGSSINKITMALWNSITIGEGVYSKLDEIRSRRVSGESSEELIKELEQFGDSVEKMFLVKELLRDF